MKDIIFGTGASATKNANELEKLVWCAFSNDVRKFDTAPSYCMEKELSLVVQKTAKKMNLGREDFYIQTKIDAWQMMDGQIETFVDNALNEMELQYLDGLLIHWPLPEYLERTWSKFLELKEKGKVKRIGICNVRSRHLYIYYDRGILPDIIQIERNPLRTCEKETDYCLNNNIEVQAYSPLCKMDKRLSDSLIISDIAQKYNKNIGQVILRWHIDTGVVPVFTSTKEERVCQYSELFDFSLNEEDVKRISSLNENYKIYLESCFCPGF